LDLANGNVTIFHVDGSGGASKALSDPRRLATRAGNIPVYFDQFSGIMLAVLLKLFRFSMPE